MPLSFDVADDLDAALRIAASSRGPTADFDPEVRAADPSRGDFQANGALAMAKRNRASPKALAEQWVAALPAEIRSAFDVEIAGPGFINFRMRPEALQQWLDRHGSAELLRQAAQSRRRGETVVIDYGGPNTAKQMHVGHLRSAVIGESLARLLSFTGARVIRDNHLGDWGTQFGKLIYAYRRWADPAALAADPLGELERLYRKGNEATPEGSPELEEARQELVKLQQGDPDSLALWRTFTDVSLRAFQEIYDRLDIRFDYTLGESFYNDRLADVYRELTSAGIAEESQGALVVFHPDHPRFKSQPFIVRKSDGAANYATTDLATLLYRVEHFHADEILYVVDRRQSDHFEQLFLTARKWFGLTGRPIPRLEHVDFGAVLGEGGRPLKTRSGDNVRLKELLEEAEQRAFALVTERSPELPESERREIAGVVGVDSVQYADLSQNRSTDYVFSWDKMISLEGNTAAYLLYAVARIRSILRKSGTEDEGGPMPGPPHTAAEIALARKLVRFAGAVRLAAGTRRPHFLALYLYELAGEFSAFYTTDKVLDDDPVIRGRRLALCRRTVLLLETGLRLLGLRTLTRM